MWEDPAHCGGYVPELVVLGSIESRLSKLRGASQWTAPLHGSASAPGSCLFEILSWLPPVMNTDVEV